jgi:methylmalonyl-CoA mutase cobalamin-binding domain/chain
LERRAKEGGNLLEAAVEAARARASVGEISMAMEKVFGRHRAEVKTLAGVYGSAYEGDEGFAAIQKDVEAFAEEEGAAPAMLVVKMGQDGHDRGAKVIATAFADIGFDVDVGPLFQTPEEAAQDAIDNDVHVVGISSQAAGHKTLAPKLIEALKAEGAGDIIVICGGVIPHQDYEFLQKAGVKAIFGPGTNIPSAARDILELIRAARARPATAADLLGHRRRGAVRDPVGHGRGDPALHRGRRGRLFPRSRGRPAGADGAGPGAVDGHHLHPPDAGRGSGGPAHRRAASDPAGHRPRAERAAHRRAAAELF